LAIQSSCWLADNIEQYKPTSDCYMSWYKAVMHVCYNCCVSASGGIKSDNFWQVNSLWGVDLKSIQNMEPPLKDPHISYWIF